MGEDRRAVHGSRAAGSRPRPLGLIAVLVVWAALLWACSWPCEQVRAQLRAVVVDCAQPGVIVVTVEDCGACECTANVIEDWAAGLGCVWRVDVAPPSGGACVWQAELSVGPAPAWPTATPDPLATRLAGAEGTAQALQTEVAGVATMVYATMEACARLGDCCAVATLTAAAPTAEPTPAVVDERMCRICVESTDCGEGWTCRDCAGAWRCVRSYFPSSDCANYCGGE